MENIKSNIKISFLWILMAISMSAHTIIMGADPAAIKSNTEWALNAKQGDWVFMTMFWLIPIWMAFLSISLKDPYNRIVNLCISILVLVINIWHFAICAVPILKGGPFSEPSPHHVLLLSSSILASILIICYSGHLKISFKKKS
jgi:hypothetical protein